MARVAVAQMVSLADVHHNLKTVESLIKQASNQQVQLLVLPENFAFMGLDERDKFHIAEQDGQGLIQDTMCQLSERYGIWIVAGTIPLKAVDDRVKAACLVYDSQGNKVAQYDKIHLFDVCVSEQEEHQESATVSPGKDVTVVDTPVGRIGLSVCYDLRFPELYRQLIVEGAEMVTVPSAFTQTTGKAHWEILLRARAIENLCYVLAANQGGVHENGRCTHGHSMLIEPWGNIITQQAEGAGLSVADIDLKRLHQLRQQFPCNEHHVLKG